MSIDRQIVITGASGFVGRNLTAYLNEIGARTYGLSMRGAWHDNLPSTCDAYIHLAGLAHDTANTVSPELYFTINTELTTQLFNRFLKSEARDFIFFSSVKAAADTVEGSLEESMSAKPLTPYGLSKLKAEQHLLAQSLPEGKRLIILRPCMMHGPGNKGNLNLLYNIVRKGIPYPLAAFHNLRSYLSIDNLNYLIQLFLTNPQTPSGVYQVADDDPVSTNELVTLMAESLNRKTRLWRIPPPFIRAAATLGDVLRLPLNSERLRKLTESYIVSNMKIKAVFNLERLPLDSSEGLQKTIQQLGRLY